MLYEYTHLLTEACVHSTVHFAATKAAVYSTKSLRLLQQATGTLSTYFVATNAYLSVNNSAVKPEDWPLLSMKEI